MPALSPEIVNFLYPALQAQYPAAVAHPSDEWSLSLSNALYTNSKSNRTRVLLHTTYIATIPTYWHRTCSDQDNHSIRYMSVAGILEKWAGISVLGKHDGPENKDPTWIVWLDLREVFSPASGSWSLNDDGYSHPDCR